MYAILFLHRNQVLRNILLLNKLQQDAYVQTVFVCLNTVIVNWCGVKLRGFLKLQHAWLYLQITATGTKCTLLLVFTVTTFKFIISTTRYPSALHDCKQTSSHLPHHSRYRLHVHICTAPSHIHLSHPTIIIQLPLLVQHFELGPVL